VIPNSKRVAKYGETFEVKPIPMDDHDVKDPVEELKEMAPHVKVIKVKSLKKSEDEE
jgi:hypothetical protein